MSHTSRTGIEQMLVSNAVDQALDRTDFRAFEGRNVFVDDKYLECVDKGYVLGSIRHRAMRAGVNLVAKAEEADVIIEPRSGAVGTDSKDTFIGMPSLSVPGPLPVSIPEIRLISRTSQSATAKIGLVAYDAKTKEVLGEGGVALAKSDDNNWFVMGAGPYQNGSVRREMSRGTARQFSASTLPLPTEVAFQPPGGGDETESGKVRLTGSDDAPVR